MAESTTPNDERVAKQQVVAYTQKSQIKHENRHIQLVREYGFHPRTKETVQDGDVLPRKFEPFPENMYGKPLEEIDQFIYEEINVVDKGDNTLALIGAVRDYEELHNKKHPNYNKRKYKDSLWKKISENLNIDDPEIGKENQNNLEVQCVSQSKYNLAVYIQGDSEKLDTSATKRCFGLF